MKFFSIIAGALCAASALAMPMASPDVNDSDLVARARRKGASPKWKIPGAGVPAVGKTGVHTRPDKDGALTTFIHYGDDVKVHGSHVEYHFMQYPQHAGKAFNLAGGTRKKGEYSDNAKAALKGIKTLGPNWVRDEKPLASLSYGSKWNTVMKVPTKESMIEGQLAKLAKSEAGKTGSGRVALIDNRTTKGTGPLGKLLRKRDLIEERGLISSIENGLEDAKNKTETTISNGIDDVKNATASVTDSIANSTLSDAFEKEWQELQSKFDDLLKEVLGDMEDAGADLVDSIKQLTFSENHQVGSFYMGMDNFEETWAGLGKNGSAPSNDQLAHDQAARDIYTSGYMNATQSIGEKVMDAFLELCDKVVGDSEDDSNAKDIFSVKMANYTGPLFTVDDKKVTPLNTTDKCNETTVANTTAKAARGIVETRLW